jgi:hypothetical protein
VTYVAKALPSWVRFRAKPKPRPMYGPPTAIEAAMRRVMRAQAAAMLEKITAPNAFVRLMERSH